MDAADVQIALEPSSLEIGALSEVVDLPIQELAIVSGGWRICHQVRIDK